MEGKKNKDREGKKGKNKGIKVKEKEKKRKDRTNLYSALNVWADICVKSFHVHFVNGWKHFYFVICLHKCFILNLKFYVLKKISDLSAYSFDYFQLKDMIQYAYYTLN